MKIEKSYNVEMSYIETVLSEHSFDNLLTIVNDEQSIKKTNYFETEFEKFGFPFLSWNANSARLLLPTRLEVILTITKAAKEVIVVPRLSHKSEYLYEIIFEYYYDNPFSIEIPMHWSDRLIQSSDATEPNNHFTFTIWTRAGKELALPARYLTPQARDFDA